jgi:transcription antitermination protein NusB
VSRHAARIAAVEILYGADVRGVSPIELLGERGDVDPYCRHLVEGVESRRHDLDVVIGNNAHGWTTLRMSPVDLNVLRVATFELSEGEVPPAAVIDEAVQIAKRFSGDDAGRFVNGVLEAVRQAGGQTGGGGSEELSEGGTGQSSGLKGSGVGTDGAPGGNGSAPTGTGSGSGFRES